MTTESELFRMWSVRWGRWVAVMLLGGALGLGLPASMAGAQQPSDPSGCDSAFADEDFCSDPGDDQADVLGEVLTNNPGGGGGGLLPKTGTEILVLVLAAGLAVAVGVALRGAAERT